MKIGVVGLPNVGKSALFNALTNAGASSANYPFCTIEPNFGVASVPDERLDYLAEIYNPQKFAPATIEFADIAGLVKGAGKGEGLGNKFLSHIRETDAVLQVVRCFEDDNITHVDGSVDPVRDVETINFELIFSDIETVEKRLLKASKLKKSGDKKYAVEEETCKILLDSLEKGIMAKDAPLTQEQREIANSMFLLTDKPVLYAANISEDSIGKEDDPHTAALRKYAEEHGSGLIKISAKLEEELAQMPEDEKRLFIDELGLEQTGLEKLVKESYKLLGLISFLTAGEKEVRAWTIKNGLKAPQAAGKIHSDFERGFIRAEIIDFDTLKETGGSLSAAREKGLIRQEGKDYVMRDGDVTVFKFNV